MRRAFSTAELLMAVAFLGTIMVVMIGLFVRLMNASTKGLDQTVALDIAQNKIDLAAQMTPAKWTFENQENHSITDPRTPTTFYYKLAANYLNDRDAEAGVGGSGRMNAMGDLYRLDIEVYWWPDDPTKSNVRQGMGRLSVNLSRIVYIQNMKPF